MHIPVMLDEAIELLKISEGKVYIDCTFGEGGHTLALLNRGAIVISIDRDFNTKIYADKIKEQFPDTFFWVNDTFSNIFKIWEEKLSPLKVDGILFDLGFSSNQIEDHNRGFSFMYESNLDMRYNQNEETLTGLEIINNFTADKLADIFYKYGEENNSRKIAKIICDARKIKKIQSCYELLEICKKCCKFYDNKHFATKIFQALRIYVNDEFTHIEKAINDSLNILNYYGRIVVITFHSLEDKIIKTKFNNKNLIQCSENESKLNKRARSAKIRWKVNLKE